MKKLLANLLMFVTMASLLLAEAHAARSFTVTSVAYRAPSQRRKLMNAAAGPAEACAPTLGTLISREPPTVRMASRLGPLPLGSVAGGSRISTSDHRRRLDQGMKKDVMEFRDLSMGHSDPPEFPPPSMGHSMGIEQNSPPEFRNPSTGHSPGVGHNSPPGARD